MTINQAMTWDDKKFLRDEKLRVRAALAATFDEAFDKATRHLVGARIIVDGNTYADMYDHAPGYAFFTRESNRTADVAPFTSMHEVKALAEKFYEELQERMAEAHEADAIYEGLFCPTTMRVVNREGKTLELFERGRWFDQYIDPKDWDEVRQQNQARRSEASYERAWDNHHSGSVLDNQARLMDWKLDISSRKLCDVPF
jgi:hypothetical protein